MPNGGANPKTELDSEKFGQPPFVEPGSEVVEGSPLCLVEVMKLYTTLYARRAGKVARVCAADAELVESIQNGEIGRLRYAGADRVPEEIRSAVIGYYVHIADGPVTPVGRVELLAYVEEQSVCLDYHRYGNLGARSGEERSEVL